MYSIIIFSLSSYYLANYFKYRETAYLFIGSLLTAFSYILEPVIIFLLPIYAALFYFSCDEKCYKKRLAQIFIFVFPSAAAIFSLSYISWLYGRGFRLIYLSNNLFDNAVNYSGYRNIVQLLSEIFNQMLIYAVPYLFILIWILIIKGITKPYIYLYLMPILLQILKYIFMDIKPTISFYLVYLLFAFFFSIIFNSEFKSITKNAFNITFILNSAFIIYQIIPI